VRTDDVFEHGKSRVKDFAMQLSRPAFALHPSLFGKGQMRDVSIPRRGELTLSSDVRLFATTFVAGFLFVSILIG
jgi:hypothetical protein